MNVMVIKAENSPINRKRGVVAKQIRVAAYCRVSTDTEEQLTSYKSQVEHYKRMVDANPEWELVDIYADEGISGTQTTKRASFQKMINDSVAGHIDLVITKSISRFARNTLDTLKYVRLLKENNVAIFFEKENINTMTMNGEMLLVILSSLAQQESESLSANVKLGLKMKMKRGEMVGFQGCLGYDYDPETKNIRVNEEEAEIVRYIFRRYIEGAGSFMIARELTQMKVKTKRGNERWSDGSVTRILKNEKYKGDLLLGKTFTVDPISHRRLENMGEEEKYYVADHHEPIISEADYEEAHMILHKRSSRHNDLGRGDKYSRKYAFSSKIECGYCGTHAIRRKWHSSTTHVTYNWQCKKSINHGKHSCPDSKGVRESLIEEAFIRAFNRASIENRDSIELLLKNIEEAIGGEKYRIERDKIIDEIEKQRSKGERLLELRLSDKIEDGDYFEKYEQMTNRIKKLQNRKMDLDIKIDEESSIERRIDTFRRVFNAESPLESFDRFIFDSLVEKVILGDIDDDGNKNPYSIIFILKTGIRLKSNAKDQQNPHGVAPSLSEHESGNACSDYEADTFGSDSEIG